MNRLQGSLAWKVCAWSVLLIAAFSSGVFGVRTLMSLDSATSGSWQDTMQFRRALAGRREEIVTAVQMERNLVLREKDIQKGTAGDLAYADVKFFQQKLEETEKRFQRENTWFRFRLLSAGGQEVYWSNLEEGETLTDTVAQVEYHAFAIEEALKEEGEDWDAGGIEFRIEEEDSATLSVEVPAETDGVESPDRFVLEYGVPEEVTEAVSDEFSAAKAAYKENWANFEQHLTGTLILFGVSLAGLWMVLWTSGHKAGEETVVLGWQEKVFFDVYLLAMGSVAVLLAMGELLAVDILYEWSFRADSEEFMKLGTAAAAGVFTCCMGAVTLILRTLAVRLKSGSLGRTTLLCRVVTWMVSTIHEFFLDLPVTWKAVLSYGVYFFANLLFLAGARRNALIAFLWLLLHAVVLLLLCWWTVGFQRLRKAATTIAGGDLEYQIDTQHLPHDLRLQAEDLNNISVGLAGAVDEKMKSERFKAELITNVSHDLKTPLTSILNYVSLLKTTEQADPKAREYIEVLERKSQRLKKLTEDLVEASKASTGVLSVQREKIGMSQLVDQALGEWEEKLEGKKLTVVTTQPEGETWVYADGRHLWRVIDNLLSNCAKYALEGTRIYLDLARGRGQVSLSVKNISREALNIPPERLMERFVRGDASRTTEGSGLGLSIARSLTELQGGSFELAVDGDLFKAIVSLPQAN